jgi:hypothetical protein
MLLDDGRDALHRVEKVGVGIGAHGHPPSLFAPLSGWIDGAETSSVWQHDIFLVLDSLAAA